MEAALKIQVNYGAYTNTRNTEKKFNGLLIICLNKEEPDKGSSLFASFISLS